MLEVIALLRSGQKINAIKEFRALYGAGLKEAMEACTAIQDAVGPKTEGFIVLSRVDRFSDDYASITYEHKSNAMSYAQSIVQGREETIVAAILARSETVSTKALKEAA